MDRRCPNEKGSQRLPRHEIGDALETIGVAAYAAALQLFADVCERHNARDLCNLGDAVFNSC